MQLPTLLLRRNRKQFKNDFGHVLILAGSGRMLGAAALTSLSALRAGAGLVTLGVPKSLNLTAQKKVTNEVMTLPLAETRHGTFTFKAYTELKKDLSKYSVIVIGPGMSNNPSTQKFILKIIELSPIPLVIDADAINALSTKIKSLTLSKTTKILTPHPGEFVRLSKLSKPVTERERLKSAKEFAIKHQCILVLKGHRTIVANKKGTTYTNSTGNVGMATAGSGDVLSGIIAAFVSQGLDDFKAAKYAAYCHGKAGDMAAKKLGRVSLIASDIIEYLPSILK